MTWIERLINDAPIWSEQWVYFTDWQSATLAGVGIVLLVLLGIWWRQQIEPWFRVLMATLLAALCMAIGSYYFFEVPPYGANCPVGCTGWRGFPLPFALIDRGGTAHLAVIDFALNLLALWLLWLAASVVWRILAIALRWSERPLRLRLLFVLLLMVLPWAVTPRFILPPQPQISGEEARLAINARRAAEFTYRITGLWVQRLALEDVRVLPVVNADERDLVNQVGGQVCLRGYTYFFMPWRHYRIDLDGIGRTALRLVELPLDEPCWNGETTEER